MSMFHRKQEAPLHRKIARRTEKILEALGSVLDVALGSKNASVLVCTKWTNERASAY